MAMEAEKSPPTPELVGRVFVEQYYTYLNQSPEIVHKFYAENSVVTRPNSEGVMSSTSTLNGINTMILSLDYKNCIVQILTANSQESFGNRVIILVTGLLTGKDSARKKFCQVFLLAPQDGSNELDRYFVLNDLLTYEDGEVVNADISASNASVAPDLEPSPVFNQSQPEPEEDTTPLEEENTQAKESSPALENGAVAIADKVIAADHLADTTQNAKEDVGVASTTAASTSIVQDDAPKKSYASVVNALNSKQEPFKATAKPVQRSTVATTPPAPQASPSRPPAVNSPPPPSSDNLVEKNNNFEVGGYAIFVGNLPMDATEEQLRKAFEQFGPIKPRGIQVRTNSGEKYPRKGGYRNDGYRGHRTFNEGRNHGRNEFENRGGFSDQADHSSGRNGAVNHKVVHQNGGGRVARQPQSGKRQV
ncbi:hypothetical protein Tsubulata_023215 [Turnera subulata]|uniref:NTF2 domain-containing protein n=1 Tax=Turnera subulata TaxID=218843 RepID=A0A9Q0J6G7_9ROSI|nr:hypothetical protein Tsubulata_023215 [Turnera subulata]